MLRGRFDVTGLVVKEEVRFKFAQELALGQATQEHGFVHFNVPVHQRADGAFVCGGAACCHQGGADAHVGCAFLLQPVQGGQQGLEGASRQGRGRLVALVLLKGRQALGLEHTLGFIRKQHRVAVKGDAHLVRVFFGGARRMRIDLRSRNAGVERRAHIGQVR